MNIVSVHLTDAAVLAALHAEAFTDSVQEPWKGEAIAALLILPGTFGFRAGGAAFVMARVASDECEILTIAVAADQRRRGLGRGLMKRVVADAGERGAKTLFLEVSEANASARALYEGLGFHERGRRPRYYAGREDAIIMARAL